MNRKFTTLAALALGFAFTASTHLHAQSASFERPPIDYMNAPVTDPVAKLIEKIDAGETDLDYDPDHGYLPSLLKALQIPESSQTLVFSKTSLQLHRITPRRPRALYFNDDIYVGWCQRGDVIEIASTDANQGAVFYTINQSPPESSKTQARILRDRGQCLTCHASSRTQNVPGYLVRSVFTESSGQPQFGSGTYTTSHSSELKKRWGGWYVTGTHGDMRHMGNEFSRSDRGEMDFDFDVGANTESLDDRFNVDAYLTPHSDIVALMVLDHQTQMHNAITAANFETREALHQSYQMNEILERESDFISESATRRIQSAAKNVVDYLLFKDEYKLSAEVAGTTDFADDFASIGPFDTDKRSLRQFDLKRRLFRYPCSYLIYSDSFDALPDEVRVVVWKELLAVLDGADSKAQPSWLSEAERTAIKEILIQTKPEFAAFVKKH